MNRARLSLLALFAGIFLGLFQPAKAADPLRSFDTVIIDPGHGGQDRGGVPGQYVLEKVMCLDVSKRVEQKLRSARMRTYMTRTNDVFIPLGARVAAANGRSRSIFVSIHFNSAANRDARGVETYFYSSKSYLLAVAIQRRLIPIAAENRGIKRRGFYVLRNCRVPAVLVECGFLTNREDARLALSASYRDRLATQIAQGILAVRRGSY
ncbi:MAG TPA: N-acetylmuramoyl-L-alanine amidase [Chthoniobacterales bacterium]|jgi:N-acetylmuramoyl-L-alanine amidase